MKIYALILFFLLNIPSSVLACRHQQEIEKSDLNQCPLIAYINEEEDNIYFYLYLKDDGNFSGLDLFYIDIESNINESIFSGYLDIIKHYIEPDLFIVEFSIQRAIIPYVKIGILASEVDIPPEIDGIYRSSGHSTDYVYIIKLKDLFDTYSGDGMSWAKDSRRNQYDEKLDKLLKTKFEKNRSDDL